MLKLPSLMLALLAATLPVRADHILPPIEFGSIGVKLQAVATGLGAPAYGISAPGDPGRLYVVEQSGLLRVIQNGVLQPGAVLDMSGRVSPPFDPTNANDEKGFLGLAFHPDFNRPGTAGYQTLYTYAGEALGSGPTYAAPNNAPQTYKNVVNEWKMVNGVVDPASRREVISFGKNAGNHNGGTLTFGIDGYLYLGLGDGGNANDVGASHIEPGGNSQNLSTPLGKMLRFDPLNPALTPGSFDAVSANGQYRIPNTNPFQAAGQAPEIYAYGFRNPYRFSVDRADLGGDGQIIVADVGQNNIEEIDRLQIGGNYGWAIKEGDFIFHRTDPDGAGPLTAGSIGARSPGSPDGLIDPITGTLGTLEYDHGDGISITGGFVYRGDAIPALYGKYVFGDLAIRSGPRVDGRLFYADLETGIIEEFLLPQFAGGRLPDGLTVHGFGEDGYGELYAIVTNTPASGSGGIVYQITAVPEPASWLQIALGGALLLRLRGLRRRP